MRSLYWISLVLVIVGAVNWGLVGLFQLDLVAALFGPQSGLSRTIYALVGIAGLILALRVSDTGLSRPASRIA